MLGVRIKFLLLRNYWWLLGVAFLAAILYVVSTAKPLQVAIPILGSILSLFYFVQKQKLEELKVFREIFEECNCRYNDMNEQLAAISEQPDGELTPDEKHLLIDYFNLCAEEYLYYCRGFIDPEVWEAWRNGMNPIFAAPRVAELWAKESSSNSYYGFKM